MTPDELAALVEANRHLITQVPGFESIKPRTPTQWIDPAAKLERKKPAGRNGKWMTPAREAAYAKRKAKRA
jgi:hypothetical protein